MSPRFLSLGPSPPTCLLALVSPTFSSPLSLTSTTTTIPTETSRPSNSNRQFPQPSHSPSPHLTPLPPSSPPANPTSSFNDLSTSKESSDLPLPLLLGKDGESAAARFAVEIIGLQIENRNQMSELMSLKTSRAACGEYANIPSSHSISSVPSQRGGRMADDF